MHPQIHCNHTADPLLTCSRILRKVIQACYDATTDHPMPWPWNGPKRDITVSKRSLCVTPAPQRKLPPNVGGELCPYTIILLALQKRKEIDTQTLSDSLILSHVQAHSTRPLPHDVVPHTVLHSMVTSQTESMVWDTGAVRQTGATSSSSSFHGRPGANRCHALRTGHIATSSTTSCCRTASREGLRVEENALTTAVDYACSLQTWSQ
ncbi:hypothetical protein HD806DRAFT_526113 [Xylariaceae sp. AK1471]|nr:hypothetical protein HD806DRAFT_526113 [Xylariaceae sp. AK1471]